MQELARKYYDLERSRKFQTFLVKQLLYMNEFIKFLDAPLDLPMTKLMTPSSAASVSNQQAANMVNAHTWTPPTSTLLSFPEHVTVSKDTPGHYATSFNASKKNLICH